MTRRESREAVFTLLYESEYNKEKTADELIADACENRGLKADQYVIDTLRGAMEHKAESDALTEEYADNWKTARMPKVSLAIFRLAVYEMTMTDVPPKAVINEAVELAKKYDDTPSPAFINGVLNKIATDKGLLEGKSTSSEQ